MSAEIQIAVVQSSDKVVLSILDSSIVSVVVEGSGSRITQDRGGAKLEAITVDETPDEITALSQSLIPVTDTSSSLVEQINSHRIILIDGKGSGSVIKYNSGGAIARQLEVDESKGAIQVLIFEKTGKTAHTIDLLTNTPEVIRLEAADGDVTPLYTVGKILSIVDQGLSDGTYTVISSSFGGGKTSITVTEAIPDLTVAGKVIVVN